MSAASDNGKGSSLGQAGISGDEMAEGLPKNLAGTTTSLPCAEYDAIVARFETSPVLKQSKICASVDYI